MKNEILNEAELAEIEDEVSRAERYEWEQRRDYEASLGVDTN